MPYAGHPFLPMRSPSFARQQVLVTPEVNDGVPLAICVAAALRGRFWPLPPPAITAAPGRSALLTCGIARIHVPGLDDLAVHRLKVHCASVELSLGHGVASRRHRTHGDNAPDPGPTHRLHPWCRPG